MSNVACPPSLCNVPLKTRWARRSKATKAKSSSLHALSRSSRPPAPQPKTNNNNNRRRRRPNSPSPRSRLTRTKVVLLKNGPPVVHRRVRHRAVRCNAIRRATLIGFVGDPRRLHVLWTDARAKVGFDRRGGGDRPTRTAGHVLWKRTCGGVWRGVPEVCALGVGFCFYGCEFNVHRVQYEYNIQ